ncbi:MAG: hypothetical protein ACJ8GN_05000 [Longimicrobiaceae bacterium]
MKNRAGAAARLLGYFEPAAWEKDGAVYRRLGVHRFRHLLLNGRYLNRLVSFVRRRPYRVISGRQSAGSWLLFTLFVEAGHTFFGGVMAVFMVRALARGDLAAAASILLQNLVINVYPVMVQRYNRGRILRVLNQDTRGAATNTLRVAARQLAAM